MARSLHRAASQSRNGSFSPFIKDGTDERHQRHSRSKTSHVFQHAPDENSHPQLRRHSIFSTDDCGAEKATCYSRRWKREQHSVPSADDCGDAAKPAYYSRGWQTEQDCIAQSHWRQAPHLSSNSLSLISESCAVVRRRGPRKWCDGNWLLSPP